MDFHNFIATYYGPVSALYLVLLIITGIWLSIVFYRYFFNIETEKP